MNGKIRQKSRDTDEVVETANLEVSADLPLRDGSLVKVKIWNNCSYWPIEKSDNKDIEGKFADLSVVVIDTELGGRGLEEFESALQTIRLVQGLDDIEAIGVLIGTFVTLVNLRREHEGKLPLHLSPNSDQFSEDGSTTSPEAELLLHKRPFFRMSEVMSVWRILGGTMLEELFGPSTKWINRSTQTLSFLTLPPKIVDKSSSESTGNIDFDGLVEKLKEALFASREGLVTVPPAYSDRNDEDFLDWNINGQQFSLRSDSQAKVLRYLFERREDGVPKQRERVILDKCGLENAESIRDLFKSKREEFDNLVEKVDRATYALKAKATPIFQRRKKS